MADSRRILFISSHPEEIDRFVGPATEQGYTVFTADNGIDAGLMLKRGEYDVVITGRNLPGFDGDRIAAFVQKEFPAAVVIVYTAVLSWADVDYFVNKLGVYRLISRPADYMEVFSPVLEDAFLLRDIRLADTQSMEDMKAEVEAAKKELKDIEELIETSRAGFSDACDFGCFMLEGTIRSMNLGSEDAKSLYEYESDILRMLSMDKRGGVSSETELKERFDTLETDCSNASEELFPLANVICALYTDICPACELEVRMENKTLSVFAFMPARFYETYMSDSLGAAKFRAVDSIISRITADQSHWIEKDTAVYRLTLGDAQYGCD